MKIVIPGGTGQVGTVLVRALQALGHDVVVLSRGGASAARVVPWDGRTRGDWAKELEGADAVINLAGRSVNCRYTAANREAMLRSRVESTRVVGEAIGRCARPPRVWLQMSTATIYAHTFGPANDEHTGRIGGGEPGAPASWDGSIRIATEWEREQAVAATPATRKVALRSALVLSPDPGGVFSILRFLARVGLGGRIAGGAQFVSWIHERDFVRAVLFLIEHEALSGAVNLTAPTPLPQRDFMRALRRACGRTVGIPATRWMIEVAAFVLRTESELLLKSRRVVPARLLEAGFEFELPEWEPAAADLVGSGVRVRGKLRVLGRIPTCRPPRS